VKTQALTEYPVIISLLIDKKVSKKQSAISVKVYERAFPA
jgi:hypothetical protein